MVSISFSSLDEEVQVGSCRQTAGVPGGNVGSLHQELFRKPTPCRVDTQTKPDTAVHAGTKQGFGDRVCMGKKNDQFERARVTHTAMKRSGISVAVCAVIFLF